jgi:UPF0755 protein
MRSLVITLIVISLASVFLGWGVYSAVRTIFWSPLDDRGEIVKFEIQSGEKVINLADRLEEEKIIKSHEAFIVYILLVRSDQDLKYGTYYFSPAMSVAKIVDLIISGETAPEIILRIKAGQTLLQIDKSLDQSVGISEIKLTDFKIEDSQKEFAILQSIPPEKSLEGYIFPDTYYLTKGASREDIVQKSMENLSKKLKNISALKEENLWQTMVLASLIEKEADTIENKKLVAGILKKRLEIGMPLQLCSTVNYITGESNPHLSTEETKIDSPYNTYQHLGLPPGPICNPGMDSIIAAVDSSPGSYLYHLSTPTGEMIFSRNLREHNQAKIQYNK